MVSRITKHNVMLLEYHLDSSVIHVKIINHVNNSLTMNLLLYINQAHQFD